MCLVLYRPQAIPENVTAVVDTVTQNPTPAVPYNLMIPRHIMQPTIDRGSKQLHLRARQLYIPLPRSAAIDLHPVAHQPLLISCPTKDRRLS